jgi:hypothetical protein
MEESEKMTLQFTRVYHTRRRRKMAAAFLCYVYSEGVVEDHLCALETVALFADCFGFLSTHQSPPIVLTAGLPAWLVVPHHPEDNECSHDHVWVWLNLLTDGLRVHAVVVPHAYVVAEVLSAPLHASLEGITGIKHRGRSPAHGMMTWIIKCTHVARANGGRTNHIHSCQLSKQTCL